MSVLAEASVTLVDSLDDLLDLRAWLGERRGFLAFDIETTGLNLGRDQIRLVQFGDRRRGWALPYADWRGAIKEILETYRGPLAAHNILFDDPMLARDGIFVPQLNAHDTMVMCHLIDPMRGIALKPSAARYVDRAAYMGKDALSTAFQKGGWSWDTIPVDHPSYWLYSALDTVLTAALADELYPRVMAQYRQVYEVEMGAIRVLRKARLKGMQLDLGYTLEERNRQLGKMEALAPRLPCNANSDQQLVAWLTSQGARLTKKTKGGGWSVDDDVLTELEATIPACSVIREYRKASKLVSSYFNNFIEMNVDGVLRPSIKPLGARTARMSITEPALQTLPRGTVVRDAFVAREGCVLVSADYSGAEMRVMASYAGEQNMIDAYLRGEDIHMWTAQEVYGRANIEREERQLAKNVGFANIYGAGDPKIAWMTGNSLAQVQFFKAKYAQLFPNIEQCKLDIISKVRERANEHGGTGWITTVLGRRIPVEGDEAYKGINYLCQSSATADVLKLKLIELDNAGLGDYILLPIHDEVLYEFPTDVLDDALATVRAVQPERDLFACPLEIDYEVVRCWGDKYREAH